MLLYFTKYNRQVPTSYYSQIKFLDITRNITYYDNWIANMQKYIKYISATYKNLNF
jgi:hypothetical protein